MNCGSTDSFSSSKSGRRSESWNTSCGTGPASLFHVMKRLFQNYMTRISVLPFCKSSSIEQQLLKRVDQIHYESVSRRSICIIGQDIRTEQGFPRERHLTVLKSYDLSIHDINTLFGLSLCHESFSSPPIFTFFLTNGLFVCVSIC